MLDEVTLHRALTWVVALSALPIAAALLFITAPYGRHQREGWGPTWPSRLGWIVMESPAVWLFLLFFWWGEGRAQGGALALLALWLLHYVHRSLVFPFRMRAAGKRMPVAVACMAFVFNGLNAYINARQLSHFGTYPSSWLAEPQFLMGAGLMLFGFAINLHSDTVLLRLRRTDDGSYHVPQGGLFRFVTSPNYLGEIIEWIGWACATAAFPGVAFAVFTAANLVPRALSHHRWYRRTFADYPPSRRVLIPLVW